MKTEIEVNIKTYEDVLEKFDCDKLSKELADFIYNQSLTFPLNKKFTIVIKPEMKFSAKQKDELVDMIRSYFGLEVKRMLIFSKHQKVRQTVIFLIGFLFIAVSNLPMFRDMNTLHEILLIIGWVSIWEFVYVILFEDIKRKIQRKRFKLLSSVKIRFE